MNIKRYNLIMHADPEFWSNSKCVDFPKDRFLEHTSDDFKGEFQSLDQNAIKKLKELPTLFAIEHENASTRIGEITDIEVRRDVLRIKYQFDQDCYPIASGALKRDYYDLNIGGAYEFYRTHWALKEGDIPDFYQKYLKTLAGVAHQLKGNTQKIQLIYAFNGMGKTRLSRALKNLIVPKNDDADETEPSRSKFLYYNAFTEDLFYWDNDLEGDSEPKLKIQPNTFTDWVMTFLKDQGQDQNIAANFQRYTSNKLNPRFNEEYKIKDKGGEDITIPAFSEVTFSYERGDNERTDHIKISKGEESCFIWSFFYTLLEQIIAVLNTPETEERETDRYNQLEYVFIDDPVSSLDENNLIELAVNLAELITEAPAELKFVITTHNPLFYNVLHNEVNSKKCYLLERFEDGTFILKKKRGDSNQSFSYHLHLKTIIEQAISDNQIEKFHFMLLRNLYEKTASFLGYAKWQDLLETAPGDKDAYLKRIINFSSHRTLSSEEVRDPTEPEKQTVKLLLDNLINNYGYLRKKEDENDTTN